METPLSAFKFGPPVSSDPLIIRMFDALLDLGKKVLNQGFFEANVRLLTRVGLWGLPVAAVLGFIFTMTVAIKVDTFSVFLYGLAWILLLLFVQYTAASFSSAGETLIKSSPSQLSSLAFLNCFALLTFVTGWLVLFTCVFQAIKTSNLQLLWAGLGGFVLCEYLACIAMNPALANITINPRVPAGEEAVGILAFLLKAFLLLVPIAFGAGVAIGTVSMAFQYINFLAKDLYPPSALALAQVSANWILEAGLLPFTGFVAFAVFYLVINLIRSVLLVPGKLDAIVRQLPAALESARSAARD